MLVLSKVIEERASLCGLLDGWGCSTSCAATIAEYAAQPDQRPDVLIFDAGSRAEVQQFVRNYPVAPILIMLGELPEDAATADEESGPASYAQLALPLRPARMRALLQQLLQPQPAEEADCTLPTT